MKQSIGFWPHIADADVASTRIRCFQLLNSLSDMGVKAKVYQIDDEPPGLLILCKRYDAESLLHALDLRRRFGTRVILDLCDNHFYSEIDDLKMERRRAQLRAACDEADLVVASSEQLALVIRSEMKRTPVVVVPDPLDMDIWRSSKSNYFVNRFHAIRWRQFLKRYPVDDGRRLIWFGNHGSPNVSGGMKDIVSIVDQIAEHHAKKPLTLCVISNSWNTYKEISYSWSWPSFYFPWSSHNFMLASETNSISIIPVKINPFTACKSNNRVTTSFSYGLCVAASALPSYEEFRGIAVLNDWGHGLETLMMCKIERERRIAEAQNLIINYHSPAVIARHWIRVMSEMGFH